MRVITKDIENAIKKSIAKDNIEYKKKAKAEATEWGKVLNGGRQIYILRTGLLFQAKANTEFLFKVHSYKSGDKILSVGSLNLQVNNNTIGDYLHKASYDDSRKIAKLRQKLKILNKRFTALVEKAYNSGELVTTVPNCEEVKQ